MSSYSSSFYSSVTTRAHAASEIVTSIVLKNFSPESIIDIGAGDGIWLSTMAKKGRARRLTAVDLPGSRFGLLKNLEFPVELLTMNFEDHMLQNHKAYDLAICVEVIEHISTDRALLLLDWISQNCRTIIFSGATTGQGGTHHINEQSQSYWLSAMMSRGLVPCDNLRPALLNSRIVPSYYQNNVFFYVNTKFLIENEISELLRKTILEENAGFKDCRSRFEKLSQKIVARIPVKFVTRLAKSKSKLNTLFLRRVK